MSKPAEIRKCSVCGSEFGRRHGYTSEMWRKSRWCSRRCHSEAVRQARPSLNDLFAIAPDENGCINWNGHINNQGYGVVRWKGTTHRAHVLSISRLGTPPSGAIVCHHCDNRKCVALEHLYWGSVRSNTDDRVSRGRQIKGEKSPHAKLSEDEIRRIRAQVSSSNTRLAADYGVSRTLIYKIKRREVWGHVQ